MPTASPVGADGMRTFTYQQARVAQTGTLITDEKVLELLMGCCLNAFLRTTFLVTC